MINVYILGGTGTIGKQTIEIILNNPTKFKVVGLSLGFKEKENHFNIIEKLLPEIVCLREKDLNLENHFKQIKFVYGDEGLIELVKYKKRGIVVTGISGSAGLLPTIEAIKAKKDIALANKETMVMAGNIVNELVKKHKVKLIPVDSEHHAIYSCLVGEKRKDVDYLTITASGGSFRGLTKEQLKNVTVEEALKHPNWNMGPKITIDSATMVNKGLEVIEAHHLFKIGYDNIKTALHRQSLVHGFVSFIDGSVKAILAEPNMKLPIGYALNYGKKIDVLIEKMDLTNLNLTFEQVDMKRYPLLKLAYDVGRKSGLYPVIYNGANEAAVQLFLNKKITFLEIEEIIIKEVETFNNNVENPTLEQILQTNEWIIRKVLETYGNNN